MGIHFDTSEVDRLAVNLDRAGERLSPKARSTIRKGAFNIKKTMQRDASGHGNLPGLAETVSYDMIGSNAFLAQAEIGFEARGQGHLDNIAAFGTVNNAAVLDHRRGLREETPKIMRFLAEDAESSVLGGDGQ